MMDIKSRLHGVTSRDTWRARGALFVTRLKATKAVWFSAEPASASTKALGTARRTTKKTASSARKRGATARKTAKRPAKKSAKKSAKKAATGT